jgi:hypothetical protein
MKSSVVGIARHVGCGCAPDQTPEEAKRIKEQLKYLTEGRSQTVGRHKRLDKASRALTSAESVSEEQ